MHAGCKLPKGSPVDASRRRRGVVGRCGGPTAKASMGCTHSSLASFRKGAKAKANAGPPSCPPIKAFFDKVDEDRNWQPGEANLDAVLTLHESRWGWTSAGPFSHGPKGKQQLWRWLGKWMKGWQSKGSRQKSTSKRAAPNSAKRTGSDTVVVWFTPIPTGGGSMLSRRNRERGCGDRGERSLCFEHRLPRIHATRCSLH